MDWRSWLRTFGLSAILVVCCAKDYCSMPGCGSDHVACNNDDTTFGEACPDNAHVVDVTDKYIPHNINRMRNEIATGKLHCMKCVPLPKAARMVITEWDNELAEMALLQAKTCLPHRDKCRSLQRFPHSGQSVAFFSYMGNVTRYSLERLVDTRLGSFFYEGLLVTREIVDSYPANGEAISRFALLANERNSHVGCAAVAFSSSETLHHFVFTCNHAVDNVVGQPIYTASDRAASGCQTGESKHFYLCNNGEYSNSDDA